MKIWIEAVSKYCFYTMFPNFWRAKIALAIAALAPQQNKNISRHIQEHCCFSANQFYVHEVHKAHKATKLTEKQENISSKDVSSTVIPSFAVPKFCGKQNDEK